MAIVKMELPKCDNCGEVWLPDKYLVDKATLKPIKNPARENPRLCKRCGKCKTPTWNRSAANGRSQRKSQHRKSSASHSAKEPELRKSKAAPNGAGLEQLYGILAKEFKELGSGEAYLRAERNWGPDVWERYEREEIEGKEHGK